MAVGATKGVRAATVGASVAAVASPGRHSTTASGDGAAESSAAKSDRRPDRGRAGTVVVVAGAQVSAVYIPYGDRAKPLSSGSLVAVCPRPRLRCVGFHVLRRRLGVHYVCDGSKGRLCTAP